MMKLIKSISILFFFLVFATAGASDSHTFLYNLSFGMSSPEVLRLQKILNSDFDTKVSETGAGSLGLETNYFGSKTKDAVIRFQQKYASEILVPAKLSVGTGFVGALTRKKLNQLSGVMSDIIQTISSSTKNVGLLSKLNENVANVSKDNGFVSISKVEPSVFSQGDEIVISGTGFGKLNTIALSFLPNETMSAGSIDGKTIKVKIDVPFSNKITEMLQNDINNYGNDFYRLRLEAMKKEFGSEGLDGVHIKTNLFIMTNNGKQGSVPVEFIIKEIK